MKNGNPKELIFVKALISLVKSVLNWIIYQDFLTNSLFDMRKQPYRPF